MPSNTFYGVITLLSLYTGLLHAEEQICSAGNKPRILDTECSELDTACYIERLESRMSVVEALLKEESMKNELIREVLIRRHNLMELLQEDLYKQAEQADKQEDQDKTKGESN